MDKVIGYKNPPYNGKYGFKELKVGEEKEIEGAYELVSKAARTYCSKNIPKKIIVLKGDKLTIKRVR